MGGLSYLTDDVNIFNIRVPEKAIIVVLTEQILERLGSGLALVIKMLIEAWETELGIRKLSLVPPYSLYTVHPKAILKIAHSIVGRLSGFTRQMDFGIEWVHAEAGSPPIYK